MMVDADHSPLPILKCPRRSQDGSSARSRRRNVPVTIVAVVGIYRRGSLASRFSMAIRLAVAARRQEGGIIASIHRDRVTRMALRSCGADAC